MSNTIQARHYTTRQSALLQQWPSDIIEAAEDVVEVLNSSCSRTMRVIYNQSGLHGANANLVGVGGFGQGLMTALTTDTKVMLLGMSWPTTAPELLVDIDENRAEKSWIRWTGQAKKALKTAASTERHQTTAAARWRVERLSALQTAFGFTIQDLATVLGITRPQLYKWLDANSSTQPQEANRARLATVERIAKEWASRSKAPLSSVHKEPLTTGGTVFTLMSADVINDAAVIGAFDELINKLQEKPKSRSQRLREAGFTRRPSVRSYPRDE